MILSKPEILRYLSDGRLGISPAPAPGDIDQVSIDLRLGRTFTTLKELPGHIDSLRVAPSIFEADLWEWQNCDRYRLPPGQLVLAHTLQTIRMPNDLVGFVEGRSSWARLGVSIHITAPKIDPGFQGTIVLEMANLGKAPITLTAEEDQPAQLLLMRISEPLESVDLYGASPEDIFQDQRQPVSGPRSG